jgi:hypothetical protein
MRLLVAPLALALLACSAGSPPPAEPTTVPLPPPPAETAATPPAPPAETVPTATAAAQAPGPPAISETCHGADLDLDVIAGGKDCDVRREAGAPTPPEAVGVELAPARSRSSPGRPST